MRRPGEILIAQGTYAAAAEAIEAVPAGERQLKGFSRPMQTFAVQGVRALEALP